MRRPRESCLRLTNDHAAETVSFSAVEGVECRRYECRHERIRVEVHQLDGTWVAYLENDRFNDHWGGGRMNDVVRSVVLGDVDLDAIYLNSSTENSREIRMHRCTEMYIVRCAGN